MSTDHSHLHTHSAHTVIESRLTGAPRERLGESSARLRLSAYDPRAVGGRQLVRLSLPAEFAAEADELELRVRCDLLPLKVSQYRFIRALNREWQAVLLSFSSRDKEHGQYVLELDLRVQANNSSTSGQAAPVVTRRWLCHSILFLPRSDTSLSEIHQVFLSSQKQVRVLAEDGAIARVQHGAAAGQQMQVEVVARDGAIAQVQLAPHQPMAIQESTPGYLAWEEALVEIAVGAGDATKTQVKQNTKTLDAAATQHPSATLASMAYAESACELPRHLDLVHRIRHHRFRILAADSWQFGRERRINTRPTTQSIAIDHPRISTLHAEIGVDGRNFVLRDHSRFGISLKGKRLSKDESHRLAIGDLIDFCSSFPGQILWQVVALFRTENDKAVCVLRCQHQHGSFEHLCLVQAPQMTPSCLLNLNQGLAQVYAESSARAYAATLPPSTMLIGQDHPEWHSYQDQT